MTRSSGSAVESAEDLAPLVSRLIEDGQVTDDDWVAWATWEIMRREDAPSWLAELTTTYSTNDALSILGSVGGSATVEDRLGSLWLSFADAQVTSTELLERALEEAGGWDTGGGFIPYQRELMGLVVRFERLPEQSPSSASRESLAAIERETVALLSPLGDRVRERLADRLGRPSASTRRRATRQR